MTQPARTILVVDDEAPLRRVLDRALTRVGYAVVTAASAEAAYALLETTPVDAALLDIRLPTMSGLALYLSIVHRWPQLDGCMAIMTGDADAEEVRTWLEQHRCAVLHKPFDLVEVEAWLAHLWEIRERGTGNG